MGYGASLDLPWVKSRRQVETLGITPLLKTVNVKPLMWCPYHSRIAHFKDEARSSGKSNISTGRWARASILFCKWFSVSEKEWINNKRTVIEDTSI